MMKQRHVAILCGGQSSEHEVSIASAANIARALDPAKFTLSVIGIDPAGVWHVLDREAFLEHRGLGRVAEQRCVASPVSLHPGAAAFFQAAQAPELANIDVVIPVLHGPCGEDGTIQGLLKVAGVPFVGSDVLGSAVSMDKDLMKRLARDAGLPIVDFLVLHRDQYTDLNFAAIKARLGLPFFVKPCNLGSSVGIHKVHDESEFFPAVDDALRFESKIIFEQGIQCRELECAVLGNRSPQASVVGEIIPHHEFYTYEAKYLDQNGASIVIPALIAPEVSEQVRALAIQAFQCFECRGLARVDFFLGPQDKVYFNELNTFPGFTSISMYPMLWQASGLEYGPLIERLIELALHL